MEGQTTIARVLEVLDAHGPYLSDRDEVELVDRAATVDDVAELALRTCLCGIRVDGFDDYHAHLRRALTTEL